MHFCHTEECIASFCILLHCCLFFYKPILLNLIRSHPPPPPDRPCGRLTKGLGHEPAHP